MVEQNLKMDLEKAQEKRATAQGDLQESEEGLKKIQKDNQRKLDDAQADLKRAEIRLRNIRQAIKDLESEESQIVEEQKKNDDDLPRLNRQIQDKGREIDEIRAQVQTATAERDRLVRAGGDRQNELATAEKNLRNSEDRLTKAERDLDNLKTQKREADDEQKKLRASEESRSRRLSEKQSEELRADKEVSNAKRNLRTVEDEGKEQEKAGQERIDETQENLGDKERAVDEIVRKINSQVTGLPKQFREKTSQLSNAQQFFGGTGIGYPYILLLGALYEFVFYRAHGINIFNYSTISDFLLIVPFIYGTAFALAASIFYTIIAKLFFFSTSRRAETAAGLLLRFAGSGRLTPRLAVCLALVPFIGASSCGYLNYTKDVRTEELKNVVSIVTEPPLGQTKKFVLIGSNSTYVFLKDSLMPENTEVHVVPLSRIVCLSEGSRDQDQNGCGSSETLDEKNTDPPDQTEGENRVAWGEQIDELERRVEEIETKIDPPHKPLRAFVAEGMQCKEDEKPLMEILQFSHSESHLPSNNSEDPIGTFVDRWENDKLTPWTVFGFASPDGSSTANCQLSIKRAKFVGARICSHLGSKPGSVDKDKDRKENICSHSGYSKEKLDCTDQEIEIRYAGEFHSADRIANSRSAVIAVCVNMQSLSET